MKEPTRAPAYACMYHGLCDTARKHGYALAIHGTMTTDLDLVAIPWTDEAADVDTLVAALRWHVGMVSTVPKALLNEGPEQKPHGRMAWNLYMDHGAKVDLSVMPRSGVEVGALHDAIGALKDFVEGKRHDTENISKILNGATRATLASP